MPAERPGNYNSSLIAGMSLDGNWSAPPPSMMTAGVLPPLPSLEDSSAAVHGAPNDALAIVTASDRMRNAAANEEYYQLVAKTRRLNPSEDKQRLEAAVCQLLMTIKRQEESVGAVEESCMFRLREQQEACNALLEQQAGQFGEAASQFRSSAHQAVQRERSAHSQLVDRLWQELTEASSNAAKY